MISVYESPVGEIMIGTREGKIVMSDFSNRKGGIENILAATNPQSDNDDEWLIDISIAQLNEYFEGKRRVFNLPIEICGSEFQRKVYSAVTKIPFGCTLTYKELAATIGLPKASRAVATCVGRNPLPIIIPCHRIIGSDGRLHGYSGGVDAKRFLLISEGLQAY